MKEALCCFLIVIGAGNLFSAPDAPKAAPKPIRIYRVGSSSFAGTLVWETKDIVDATGAFVLNWDEKKDSARYTRADAFIKQPGSYEEWCASNLPVIEKGKYDYVVLQTIDWLGLTPAEQEKLVGTILPDLTAKIRKTGADVILYDKFLLLKYKDEADPRAKTWVQRYPDGVRLNNLLHIEAAKKAGITKITFGGEAVLEGWEQAPFKDMKYFYCSGHPGVLASYISACDLSYLMTGIDPVGSPGRTLEFSGFAVKAFADEPLKGGQAFYDTYKSRIKDGKFEMTDAEAKQLQELAMKYHRRWDGALKAALADPAAYAKVEAEIHKIQADMGKPQAYGMSQKGIDAIGKETAEAEEPGGLSPSKIEGIRKAPAGLHPVALMANRFLTPENYKLTVKDCSNYWTEKNSKFRDDVLYEALLYEAQVQADGNREEVGRMKQTVGALWAIIGLPACRATYERMPEEKRAAFLADCNDPNKGFAPALSAQFQKFKTDAPELFKAWDAYLAVWTDPNLMDKLKAEKFSKQVFLEADAEFAKKIGSGGK